MNSRRKSYMRDLRLRLRDAEFTTLASKYLKRQTHVFKFFQVMNSKPGSYTRDLRLRLQNTEFTMLAFEDLRRRKTQDSEVNKLMFHQLTRGPRLQIMEAW